jgi:hypothetical protein
MSDKLNFLIYLNAYSDQFPSNNPSRSNFKWTRDINSLAVSSPSSVGFTLAPGETRTLFSGTRTLTQDSTTTYSIALAPISGQNTTYQLTWSGGTNPGFRTGRTSGADASTQITATLNGTVLTFASTGGTPLSLISGGVQIGDFVQIGNLFNIANQGQFQIVSLTATSFSVVNAFGVNEGPITLGSGFASQIDIFSAAGVQPGDTLLISGGFSPVTRAAYIVTAVTDMWVQFSSTALLPTEGPIMTEAITFYFDAQRLVYLESNQKVTMVINGQSGNEIDPIANCMCQMQPGIFLRMSTIYSMTVTNVSQSTASLYLASIE